MSNKNKTPQDAKVSIPIVGEEESSLAMGSGSQKSLRIPILDSSTLNNILIGAVSPIIILVGGLYFVGMAANFIFYPIRFILKIFSILYSFLHLFF